MPLSLLHASFLIALLLGQFAPPVARANEPFRYPEATHGKGELRYIDGIPVVTLAGTPEEIGDQLGILALKPAKQLTKLADEVVARHGWKRAYDMALSTGNLLLLRFPRHYVQELDAAASSSTWPRALLAFGNTIPDLRHIIQCSAVIIESERSATGTPLFGRNLDWPPTLNLHEYTFVAVYRPAGKRAFASITLPGMLGCSSGMNDAGLALAMLDAESGKDGSVGFNPAGVPTLLLLRRILEECASIEEAVTLLRSVERASSLNIALCDRRRGAVVEVTPKTVALRAANEGVVICTNHFRSTELATSTECSRYASLAKSLGQEKYTVADMAHRLDSVHQGEMTLQSMVFEPSMLRLHLAFGKGPATRLPMGVLELSGLLTGDENHGDENRGDTHPSLGRKNSSASP